MNIRQFRINDMIFIVYLNSNIYVFLKILAIEKKTPDNTIRKNQKVGNMDLNKVSFLKSSKITKKMINLLVSFEI